MEKLNEYLQQLLSSCSDELRLVPDKNPYLVAESGMTDVANVPLLGTQISTMVFPLIPPDAKSALPHNAEVEFIHPHKLGNFSFTVQKSPAGFIVAIRPQLADSSSSINVPEASPEAAASEPIAEAVPAYEPQPEFAQATYDLESSSAAREMNTAQMADTDLLSDLLLDEGGTAREYVPGGGGPELEVISFNDPEYQTVFSDTSTYEPPGKRDFGSGEYEPPTQDIFAAQESTASLPVYSPPPLPPAEAAFVPAPANAGMASKMDAMFNKMAELGASDLHLSVSVPPMIRKDGKMKLLGDGGAALTPDAMRELLTSIMPPKNQEEFAARRDTDFAYEMPGLARFRCNIFMDRKGMGGVFRIIPSKILTAEELGLSKAIMDLCTMSKGLVVVTGPTGSGKSTTLCAMVDSINKHREDHIITIEDPIEFTHENQKCVVNQREVHNHTDSFKDALRAALREDPDIVLVGEMRDLETISIAIETAETGHLGFGTLHTTTAASTVDRIIDQFPSDRQGQIRVMLAESLKGVISQMLCKKIGGGRVPVLEILIGTPSVSNLIREAKIFQIPSIMQTGKKYGMCLMNESFADLVKKKIVEPQEAYAKAFDKPGLVNMLKKSGIDTSWAPAEPGTPAAASTTA